VQKHETAIDITELFVGCDDVSMLNTSDHYNDCFSQPDRPYAVCVAALICGVFVYAN